MFCSCTTYKRHCSTKWTRDDCPLHKLVKSWFLITQMLADRKNCKKSTILIQSGLYKHDNKHLFKHSQVNKSKRLSTLHHLRKCSLQWGSEALDKKLKQLLDRWICSHYFLFTASTLLILMQFINHTSIDEALHHNFIQISSQTRLSTCTSSSTLTHH